MPKLVLASGSPRRIAMLRDQGYAPEVVPANVVEVPQPDEAPEDCAQRLAEAKSLEVATRHSGAVVLAADTVVAIGGTILGKPTDEADFQRMMRLLSARPHEVWTAVSVRSDGSKAGVRVKTKVSFKALSDAEIDWYWRTGEPRDKAGGYALQGQGSAFIHAIEGSPSNVVGLPLPETIRLLTEAGIPPPWSSR